ncbi:hypothetical protein K440DRAFT_615922 [Wilcoxina mikolae CBS 423.85]|nr:hypothetical protein K440DRAFT_615922 [Wilcoxina mikolae CBS 423.85]
MITSESGVPPLRRSVPEPKTPERDDSDIEDLSPSRSDYSPKRGLRRIRGSISGASNTSIPVASDEECVIVNVSSFKSRRNSSHLHHPKQLKNSPKSAYFEDAGVETGRRSCGVMEFESAGVPIPQSPLSFDEGVPVGRTRVVGFEPVDARRPDSPPASTVVSSDDEDSEHGGALLDAASSYSNNTNANTNTNAKNTDTKGKARVLAKSGKKVTPWATRASSFTSERPESLIPTEESESPEPVVRAAASLPVKVEENSGEPEVQVAASLPADVQADSELVVQAVTSLPVTAEVDSELAVRAVKSFPVEAEEDSGDEVFEDAIEEHLEETPIAVDTSSGSSLVDSMQEIRARTARNSKSHDPPTSDKIKPTDEKSAEEKRVILIYEPPNSAATSPTDVSNTSPNPILPALKLIPATPLALSSSAEKEKQLGHPTALSRKATTSSRSSPSIPEDAVAEVEPDCDFTSNPKRPTLADVPKKIRESKLHPWWMPKRVTLARDDGGDLEHVLSAPSERSTRFFDDLKSRRASTGDKEEKKNGRVTKRIKGTKFVVEFVGWRRIGEVFTGKRRKEGVVLDLEGRPIRKKRADE